MTDTKNDEDVDGGEWVGDIEGKPVLSVEDVGDGVGNEGRLVKTCVNGDTDGWLVGLKVLWEGGTGEDDGA